MVLAHIRKKAFTSVIKESGLRGLYLGFSSTLYRDIYFNMVFFSSREVFVKLYKRYYSDPDPWTRVMLGYPAGTLASIVACPFDVIKTRQQGSALGTILLITMETKLWDLCYIFSYICIYIMYVCTYVFILCMYVCMYVFILCMMYVCM